MQPIIKKIPGILPPPPKTEIDGKITDLSSKTIAELCELRDRQLKLLNNKAFISKLPDKGAKIQAFHDKIVSELKAKQEEEQTCRMFDNMKLNGVDKDVVQQVEWVGKIQDNNNTYLDSDDDSEPEDVLHILSQTTAPEKQVKVLPPEKPLITTEDLLKIGELPHVKYIVEKTEVKPKPKSTGNFKPFRTTKSDSQNPEKEILRKKHKHWEVTAATPPPSVHGPAKVLSIEESLKLQKEYNAHLKEIEAQHAAEKLLARAGIKMAELPEDKSSFGKYRNVDSDDSDASDPEGSDKEVHDEEPERGGVVFTVMK
ncbi:uncharacterized protein LOC118267175 [Spodoptera frugiperda]|uniref:Uncharacterized protein LOC118267175 n=1 Tax=Spodoptera frugiperda TaxID=7108 RepID=A0A9R0D1U4_SPOFR|nr:uncharacterized protein LOC118267175 [Spodoptera frugiperda]